MGIPSQVQRYFKTIFLSHRADKPAHTDGKTDGQRERRMDGGEESTPPADGVGFCGGVVVLWVYNEYAYGNI